MNCTYCYEPKSLHKMMTAEHAKSYIRNAVSSLDNSYEGFEIQFMGGEPLLAFRLIKEVSEWLWAETWPLPLVQIFAATNGTLLDDEKKSWFTGHKDRICLGLSFDGNALMQNRNRSGSYSAVDLSYFASTWPNQSVKMTISPETVSQLYEGVMHLQSQGFRNIAADLAQGANIPWEQIHLDVFNEQLKALSDYYVAHPDCPRISFLDIDVVSVFHNRERNYKHCGCGEQLVCIDCDGREYACHLFSPVSATTEQSDGSKSIDFSDHNRFVSDKCRNCLLINVCTRCCGMNYLCNGDISKPSPFFCAAYRIQFAIACSLQLRLAEALGDKEQYDEVTKVIECMTNKTTI